MNNQNIFKLSRRHYHYAVMQDSQAALIRVHLVPEQLTLLMQVLFNQYPGSWSLTIRQLEQLFWPMPIGGKSCFLDSDQQEAFKALHPYIRFDTRREYDTHVPIITDIDNIHVIEETAYRKYVDNALLNVETKRFLKPAFKKLAYYHKSNLRRLERIRRLEAAKKDFALARLLEPDAGGAACFV